VSVLGPTALTGQHVRLEPLRPVHAEGLLAAGQDESIWTWLPAKLTTREAVDRFIAEAMKAEAAGTEYAFTVSAVNSGRVLGSTRYIDVAEAHKGVEIGWTWYARDAWATKVNPECKFLLLKHAFEDWAAIRVMLKTDHKNERSQQAILRLGALFEGRLRNHRIRPDGTLRDTMVYSITPAEWPWVQAHLLERLRA